MQSISETNEQFDTAATEKTLKDASTNTNGSLVSYSGNSVDFTPSSHPSFFPTTNASSLFSCPNFKGDYSFPPAAPLSQLAPTPHCAPCFEVWTVKSESNRGTCSTAPSLMLLILSSRLWSARSPCFAFLSFYCPLPQSSKPSPTRFSVRGREKENLWLFTHI